MRTSFLLGGLAAALVASVPVAAQSPLPGGALQVTPYLGYMFSSPILKGPVGTSVSTTNADVYGAQLGLKMTPNISLIGNLAYSTGQIEVGLPFIGGASVGKTTMLLYDGGLELGFAPMQSSSLTFSPFVQFGAGAIRYEANASVLTTTATNFAGNVGLGADIDLVPGFGMRLMVKDYIGKFDFKEATTFDVTGETTHNVALSAGLRFTF